MICKSMLPKHPSSSCKTIIALAVLASTACTPVAWAGSFAAVIKLNSLDGTDGFRLDGVRYIGSSGWSVGCAGDVNGDGFADLIVGAPREKFRSAKRFKGSSYVVFGKASGFAANLNLSAHDGSLNGSNGFQIKGTLGLNYSGFSVATGEDVNGDGFADLIIGTRRSGLSYVVFGKVSGFAPMLDLSSLNGSNGFRLDGGDGFSVASAGDVNGDGFADLIIGAAWDAPGGKSGAGSSYVVFGKASGFAPTLDLSSLNGSNGFRLDGASAGDESGDSVAGAGDVNGDGFADLIIGAEARESFAGSSYVLFGKASGFSATVNLSSLDGSNGFRLDGASASDITGRSVAGAGDINGDGFADLLIGAFGADPGGKSYAGSSYVVFGKASGFSAKFNLSSLNGSNGFRLDGASTGDQSGYSVASAGDVNGDGFADLIIGANGADPGGKSDAGSSYVVFGKSSGFAPTFNLSSLNGSNGFRLDGASAGDRSGRSVAGAGDVNGDDFADLIIGAAGADPGGKISAGSSYVVFGSGP